MNKSEFKHRTKQVGLRVIRLVTSLPRGLASDVMGRQVLRSATSVGANYRSACRALSRADLIAKLGHVEEEADETLYWLELLVDSGIVPESRLRNLTREVNEILAMIVASRKTLRLRRSESKIENRKSKIERSDT